MSSIPTFVNSVAVSTRPLGKDISTCAFTDSVRLVAQFVRPRRAELRMNTGDYKIEKSEYVDPDSDDDSGDGFIGESEMDDMLGVSMPEDLASFEIKEIQNATTRDELVAKLRDIASRRRDILEDRRKGMGMDNVNNYLGNL